MKSIYLVLDEYEQNDGYFSYDAAFNNREDAEKFKNLIVKFLEKEGGEPNHDVFEIEINEDKTPEEVFKSIIEDW